MVNAVVLTDEVDWVCYVYQNRFAIEGEGESEELHWCIHDFDPLRVRKVQLERLALKAELAATPNLARKDLTGPARRLNRIMVDDPLDTGNSELDGVLLFQDETVLPATLPLMSEIRTGSEFPYISSDKEAEEFGYEGQQSIMLLDESRLVFLLVSPNSRGAGG